MEDGLSKGANPDRDHIILVAYRPYFRTSHLSYIRFVTLLTEHLLLNNFKAKTTWTTY